MDSYLENTEKIILYWKDSAERDYQTMLNLYKSEDYNWSLFLGHLVLEKLFKAHYVKKHNRHALLTHDLLRLASSAGLILTEEKEDWLDSISSFNLNARYDNYKNDFFKLCTKEFTDIWIERIKSLRIWLISEL